MNKRFGIFVLVSLCIAAALAIAETLTDPGSAGTDASAADPSVTQLPKPARPQQQNIRPARFPQNNQQRQTVYPNNPAIGRQVNPLPRQAQGTPLPQKRQQAPIKKKIVLAEAYLAHLRQENPAEADRLEELRKSDKKMFAQAINQRLAERKLELALQNHPQVLQTIQSLPEGERQEVIAILSQPGAIQKQNISKPAFHVDSLPGVSDAASKGPADPRPPGDAQKDEATFALARQYRTSSDPLERERLNQEIQKQLEEIFDSREEYQLKQVKTIEATLKQLKERIELRKQSKDEIIERRRMELTGDDDLAW